MKRLKLKIFKKKQKKVKIQSKLDEKIDTLIYAFRHFKNEKESYINSKQTEKFVDDEHQRKKKLIEEAENNLFKKISYKQNIDTLIDRGKEIVVTINQFKIELGEFMKSVEEEDKRIVADINQTIETIKIINKIGRAHV